MLFNLLTLSALWLGFGFVAGLFIWLGLVIRRATLTRRRPVVSSEVSVWETGERGFDGAARDAGVTHHAVSEGSGGVSWADSASARRECGGRELLSFPK